MSEAADLLQQIKESMVPGNVPVGQPNPGAQPAPSPPPNQSSGGAEITDQDQEGNRNGNLWVRENPNAAWEQHSLGNPDLAAKLSQELRGKPIDQIRQQLSNQAGYGGA